MRRADRPFQLVQYLRGGRLVTAAKLADRLEVSERTIYRDIADLQSTGLPVDGAAGVGYVMRSGYDLPPLMFTRDEVLALVVGIPVLADFRLQQADMMVMVQSSDADARCFRPVGWTWLARAWRFRRCAVRTGHPFWASRTTAAQPPELD